MWIIQRVVKKGDYLYAVVPDHPKAIKYGYVLEHRIVMENKLGRLLIENEEVHHIDGNRYNNSLENLQLITKGGHQRMHQLQYPEGHFIDLVCHECGKHFQRPYNKRPEITRQRYVYCSRRCNGKQSMRAYRSDLLSQKP